MSRNKYIIIYKPLIYEVILNVEKYKSVAVKVDVVNKIKALADKDMRSVPRTIEFLTNEEYKRRKI